MPDLESSEPTAPSPRPARRGWQFSLRAVMLLTVVAAFAVAWWKSHLPPFRKLAGGYEVLSASTQGPTGREVVKDGPFRLIDPAGRTRAYGSHAADTASGPWTIYYANGWRAAQGYAEDGCRTGRWIYWSPSGHRTARVTYSRPLTAHPARRVEAENKITLRNGPATYWWEDGTIRAEGSYQLGLRDGPWREFGRRGRPQACGVYRAGKRQGVWTLWPANRPSQRVYFAEGRPLGSPEEVVERAADCLQRVLDRAADWPAAVDYLAALGPAGVPALRRGLQSPHPEIRTGLLRCLAQMGREAQAATPEVRGELRASDRNVRLAAAVTLYTFEPTADTLRRVAQHMQPPRPAHRTWDAALLHASQENWEPIRRLSAAQASGPERDLAIKLMMMLIGDPPNLPVGTAARLYGPARQALQEIAANENDPWALRAKRALRQTPRGGGAGFNGGMF